MVVKLTEVKYCKTDYLSVVYLTHTGVTSGIILGLPKVVTFTTAHLVAMTPMVVK